jgi:TonB family protein
MEDCEGLDGKDPVFHVKSGFFYWTGSMLENSSLKFAAFISLGIHLLFFGIALSLFQASKRLPTPTPYVRVTILPMVSREEPKGKITPPVPLTVGDQNRKGLTSDQEGRNGETALPSQPMAKNIPFEEPRTPQQEREEQRTSKESTNFAVTEEQPSGPNLSKEENSVSSQETGSNGVNQSVALPSLRSGESYGDGISFHNAGGGLGIGKGSGNGGSGKGGSGNSGKGTGILSKLFPAHGGGKRARASYGDNPKPIYPQEAREKGYEGEVVLRVEVLANGRVGQIEIKKSSSYEVLDRSALTAVKQWKFIPAKKGDVAIALWVNIPIKFQLQ